MRSAISKRSIFALALGVTVHLLLAGCSDEESDVARIALPQEARVRRLTHGEWTRSLETLLRLENVQEVDGAAPDSMEAAQLRLRTVIRSLGTELPGGLGQGDFIFEGKADSLEVDGSLASAYANAAKEIAENLSSEDRLLHDLLPLHRGSNRDLAQAFIVDFGMRAFRRPLNGAEIERYLELFFEGVDTYFDNPEDPGAFERLRSEERTRLELRYGIRLLLEAFLQSPHFLYRLELSSEAPVEVAGDQGTGQAIPLSGFERATRLSYFFFGTGPDEPLLNAAHQGSLSTRDGVRAIAQKMADDPRSKAAVLSFFAQVLNLHEYEGGILPDRDAFENVPDQLGVLAEEEARRFIEFELYEAGNLRNLFTSERAYLVPELAEFYGVDLPEGADEPTLLPDRPGFFTRVGFLALESAGRHPDPIHRGVFLAQRINCVPLEPPPANIPPLRAPEGQTNRALVEELTERPGSVCASCHTDIINPYGFAFEEFDAVGGLRTMDGHFEVNSSAQPLIDGQPQQVSGGAELSRLMAESFDVHHCFAQHLLSFAQGRDPTEVDEPTTRELANASLEEHASIRDLMVQLASSDLFLFRQEEDQR